MADVRDVAVLVGSLRKESVTRKIARAMMKLAPPSLAMEIVEIRELPMYDPDLETDTPPREWVAFRDRIRRADALLFATARQERVQRKARRHCECYTVRTRRVRRESSSPAGARVRERADDGAAR